MKVRASLIVSSNLTTFLYVISHNIPLNLWSVLIDAPFLFCERCVDMKRWIDAGLIAERDEVPNELYEFDDLMKSVPNFDKSDGAKKIFQRKEYSIYKASDGYIVHNTNKEFMIGHTHVRSFNKAKSIVDLCIRKKLPNTPRRWEIESLMRVTNNNTYRNKLRDLL